MPGVVGWFMIDFWVDIQSNLIEIKYNTIEELNHAYFMLPDEIAATKWAVNWLKKKENRQRAREFEKELFEAFRG